MFIIRWKYFWLQFMQVHNFMKPKSNIIWSLRHHPIFSHAAPSRQQFQFTPRRQTKCYERNNIFLFLEIIMMDESRFWTPEGQFNISSIFSLLIINCFRILNSNRTKQNSMNFDLFLKVHFISILKSIIWTPSAFHQGWMTEKGIIPRIKRLLSHLMRIFITSIDTIRYDNMCRVTV